MFKNKNLDTKLTVFGEGRVCIVRVYPRWTDKTVSPECLI